MSWVRFPDDAFFVLVTNYNPRCNPNPCALVTCGTPFIFRCASGRMLLNKQTNKHQDSLVTDANAKLPIITKRGK